MEILLNKDEYSCLRQSFEATLEESVQAELSLPEYMPEILRIVKSSAQVLITGVGCVGERLTVDGICELKMLYTSADGAVYVYSQQCSFSRYCENAELSSADDIKVKPVVNFVNCRATSQKRAEIKASLRLFITAFSGKKESVISFDGNGAIEEKCLPVSAASLGCKRSKSFSMSETLPVEEGSAAFIVSTFAAAEATDIKKIGNKIMIRGDAVAEIAFVPTENKKTVEHIRHTLPINQILEFDGMEDRFTGNVVLSVAACDITLKSDSDGVGRAFDIALSINAEITMWEQKELFVVTDAYSVKGAVELSKESLSFYCNANEVRDRYTLKASVDASKTGVTSVLDATAECGEPSFSVEENELVAAGTVKASFLLRDSAGELAAFEKMFDYKYTHSLSGEYVNPRFFAAVTLCSFDCFVKSSEELQIAAELKINCTLVDELAVEGVSEITVTQDEEKTEGSAITVYFPQKEELLWDIARKYNTTVSLICAENELDGETTAEKSVIFIPSVNRY